MPATLTSVTAASANPGDQITLTGTGFLAGAVVTYVGAGQTRIDHCAVVVSNTVITSIVPDFGGDAAQLSVTVQNTDEGPTAAVALQLLQYPPVDTTYPLVGLNAVRRALGLTDNEHDLDATLSMLILHASAQMLDQVTYDIKPVTLVNELYDGSGSEMLELVHQPVVSVSAVTIDGNAADMSTIRVYPYYIAFEADEGMYWNPRLRAGCQLFNWGRQNVQVSYIAGYTNVPADLSEACVHQVTLLRNTLSKEGVLSEQNSQTSSTTQYAQVPLAPYVQRVCNRYRKSGVQSI